MIVREVMLHKPGEEIKAVRIPRKWSFTSIPDETKMRNQHNELVDVLKAENVKINYLRKPTKAYPNLYLMRDHAVVINKKALICNFANYARVGEENLVKRRLPELGVKITGQVFMPGVLEGGNVFIVDRKHAVVGLGNQANDFGVTHLRKTMGLEVDCLRVKNPLRNNFNFLNEMIVMSETLAYTPIYYQLKEKGYDFIVVSKKETQQAGIDFLPLSGSKIVNAKSTLNKKFKMYGFDVIEVDISELAKGGGGVRSVCMPFY